MDHYHHPVFKFYHSPPFTHIQISPHLTPHLIPVSNNALHDVPEDITLVEDCNLSFTPLSKFVSTMEVEQKFTSEQKQAVRLCTAGSLQLLERKFQTQKQTDRGPAKEGRYSRPG
jgi:hypothetical protein